MTALRLVFGAMGAVPINYRKGTDQENVQRNWRGFRHPARRFRRRAGLHTRQAQRKARIIAGLHNGCLTPVEAANPQRA